MKPLPPNPVSQCTACPMLIECRRLVATDQPLLCTPEGGGYQPPEPRTWILEEHLQWHR